MGLPEQQKETFDQSRQDAAQDFIKRLPILGIENMEVLIQELVRINIEMIASDFYYQGMMDGIKLEQWQQKQIFVESK